MVATKNKFATVGYRPDRVCRHGRATTQHAILLIIRSLDRLLPVRYYQAWQFVLNSHSIRKT